jgi:hypothetical protein
MNVIDHDAVQEWLDEGFFTPAGLEADDPTARAAREHLAACADCTEHAVALRRAALKLDLARGPSALTRARVLATVKSVGRSRGRGGIAPELPEKRRWWAGGLAWRLAAAALVIAVVGGGLGMWLGRISAPAAGDLRELSAALAMMTELAGKPGTTEMVLRDAAGNPGGVALLSTEVHDIAVFTSDLPPLASGRYACWFERDGQRTWLGPMHAGEGVDYWAGDMDDAPPEMEAGDRIVIASGADAPEVLGATF